MKKVLFLVSMIGFSLYSYAQDGFKNDIKPIPAKDIKIKEPIPPKEALPKVSPPVVEEKKPVPVEINPEDFFKNTYLYKKEANTEGIYYRRNQYLGNFKVKTFVSTIRFRDAAFVDGDKIKIYLNDKVIEPEVGLDEKFKDFKINLIPGSNKIDFEALNEGSASPNTAQFEVYDENGTVISASQWNVGTGYKATIILVKE
ncbi:hypothetical protein [Flavobacterium sp. WC2509]|uniref:hypothetical protein n=1 Tax=Flavobacterium sp. WC2509 TaxID=3461406 RepID=UPI004043F722